MAMPSRGGRDGGIPEVPWPASLDDLVSSGSAKELVYKSNMHGAENEERFLFGLHTYAHMCMTPPHKRTYTHTPPRIVGSEGNILVTIYTGQNSENSLSPSLGMQNNTGLLSTFLGF